MRHDAAQARLVWPPESGTFSLRLVPKGWCVPARIQHDAAGLWQAEVDGVLCEGHRDPAQAAMVATVWHHGLRIGEAHYRWLLALKVYAQAHAPEHPCLFPRQPIDPRRLTPIHVKDTIR